MDLGIKVEKGLFAPRIGVTFRATPSMVIRGGFGITNDPYSLARPMRTNHPILLNLTVQAPNTFAWAGRTADGVPPIPDPDLGNGIIPIPSNVTAFTLPDEFNRGYIKSWNAAVQKELKWGFVGEAAYVATRQIDQLGFLELNWSPIGGGQAGRQLNQKFGRTAQTRLVAPVGDTKYDALQARLDRRFANGFQIGVGYTLSKSTGIAGAPRSDGTPRIMIPEFYHLNTAISPFDRTHNLQITNLTELPFGPGRRWLNGGGVVAAIVGGWQVNNILSFTSGTPFDVTASRHVAERTRERAARRPGEGRRGNPRGHRSRRTPGSIRWRSSRSPRRASAPPPGAPCAGPATPTGTWASSGSSRCRAT